MKEQHDILYPDSISGPNVTWRDKIIFRLRHVPFWIPMVTSVVIICTVFIVRNVKQINEVSEASVLTRALLPEEESLLKGMYCVKSLGSDGDIYSTAEISGIDGDFYVTIYSDYAPLNLEASLHSDGTLHCEGLGDGKITYKPSTESISIIFTKNNKDICEFSK